MYNYYRTHEEEYLFEETIEIMNIEEENFYNQLNNNNENEGEETNE